MSSLRTAADAEKANENVQGRVPKGKLEPVNSPRAVATQDEEKGLTPSTVGVPQKAEAIKANNAKGEEELDEQPVKEGLSNNWLVRGCCCCCPTCVGLVLFIWGLSTFIVLCKGFKVEVTKLNIQADNQDMFGSKDEIVIHVQGKDCAGKDTEWESDTIEAESYETVEVDDSGAGQFNFDGPLTLWARELDVISDDLSAKVEISEAVLEKIYEGISKDEGPDMVEMKVIFRTKTFGGFLSDLSEITAMVEGVTGGLVCVSALGAAGKVSKVAKVANKGLKASGKLADMSGDEGLINAWSEVNDALEICPTEVLDFAASVFGSGPAVYVVTVAFSKPEPMLGPMLAGLFIFLFFGCCCSATFWFCPVNVSKGDNSKVAPEK